MKKKFIKYKLKIKATIFAFRELGRWYKNQINKEFWKSMSDKERIEFNDSKLQSYKLAYENNEVLKNPKKYEDLT